MPKPHAPSPAAFAKKTPQQHAPKRSTVTYSQADVTAAEAFGRVDDNGTVFVREGDAEREVGQFPDASKEEALALYARRYLDLKAKLDLFANRLKSANVKNREIDDTLKTLAEETAEHSHVGAHGVRNAAARFESADDADGRGVGGLGKTLCGGHAHERSRVGSGALHA